MPYIVATVDGKSIAVAEPAPEAYLYAGRLYRVSGAAFGFALRLEEMVEPDRLDPVRTKGAELAALLAAELGADVDEAAGDEPGGGAVLALSVIPPEPLAHFLKRVAEIVRA